jgi:GNAT superfamily N-acetyltransferase
LTFLNRLKKRLISSLKRRSKISYTPTFLEESCTFEAYDSRRLSYCDYFDCDHQDLNDFFSKDSVNYSSQLLGKTYCFTLDESPKTIIAAFTISNDSIKTTNLPGSRKKVVQKDIPRGKTMRSYPAVLIGRLGVNKEAARQGLGREVMDFIKAWFVDKANKTGCRFIVVDAYNEERPKSFYEKNGFLFLFSTEHQEKEYLGLDKDDNLPTRLMYFDLITLRA